ncbi:type I-E CRISPR-associated protein Cse2/CasB [Promicromonospora sp. NFX87]|uniref:type I-E CRISPR-associated protein Cse2/CasB n=1 Tax=Promicromonospora sp. NFX87 TaxID=3402691 RepID=UPI003AFA96EA
MMADNTALRSAGRTDATAVEKFVASRVKHLQDTRLERGARGSRTVALLARLRRVATAEPGVDLSVWDDTLAGAPGSPDGSSLSKATEQERAIHLALAMYATAQQSRTESAHEYGTGLGRAVRRLEGRRPNVGGGDTSPVRRRFDALATSVTMPELAVHLRGLITQLRGERITLDYARLARDLFVYQLPGQAHTVRRAWARDYAAAGARTGRDTTTTTDTTITNREN